MCLFIETMRVHHGKLQAVTYHNNRLNRTRFELLGMSEAWDLAQLVQVPTHLRSDEVYKCRLVYGLEVEDLSFEPYRLREVPSLQLVEANNINYTHKYANRQRLNQLVQNSLAHDVLILKNNYLTDTSYANVAFFDGTEWYTPNSPLLKGTKRQLLLEVGMLKEALITLNELGDFCQIRLINAMMDWHESPRPSIIYDAFGDEIWRAKPI